MRNLNRNSDEVLLTLVAHNDEKAFEELFNRYWKKAHTIAYSKLRSHELAQEVVHDLFVSFWQRRHSLEIENFEHYVRVSIKYIVIRHVSKELKSRKYLEEYRPVNVTDEEETSMAVEYDDLVKTLDEKLKALPEKTQEVFRLNRLEGRSVSEIATQLNLSEKAIEYHITRSRKELRLYLKEFLTLLVVLSGWLPISVGMVTGDWYVTYVMRYVGGY